jgi:hypothetical protein
VLQAKKKATAHGPTLRYSMGDDWSLQELHETQTKSPGKSSMHKYIKNKAG